MNLPFYQPDPAKTTRFLFFTGKGGVGKTSLSCATALKLVEAGKRVLLVSTDPASNLDEVLETKLTNTATSIAGAPGLHAINIDPVAAMIIYLPQRPIDETLPHGAAIMFEAHRRIKPQAKAAPPQPQTVQHIIAIDEQPALG